MGYYIMKPDPDDDFYVEWSTYTDTPTAFGPRSEFQEEDPDTYSDERFERTDREGTSHLVRIGRWDRESFWIGRSWEISRDKLKPFLLEAYEATALDFWAASCKEAVEKYCKPLVFDD